MVCSIGNGRMTVLARILAAGSLSQEEGGRQKLTDQYIHQDLREADEANLLDEEDMHVFGLRPMSDPLHLVCCNACKKPVKASQYAAHSELCRSFNSSKEMQLKVNGAVGNRKPPRKMKKNLISDHTNQTIPPGEQQRLDCLDTSLDGQRRPLFSGNGTTSMMAGVSPENAAHQDSVRPPPAKRLKIISRQPILPVDHSETASGLAKITSTQGKEVKLQSAVQNNGRNASDVNLKGHEDVCNCSLLQKGPAVPLATKIYYSQKNHHLRSTFAHFYHLTSASAMQLGNNVANLEFPHGGNGQLCSPQRDSLCELVDGFQKEIERSSHESDMNHEQSSEVCSDKAEVFSTAASNQYPVDNFLSPQMKSKYLAASFVDSSGRSLRTAQQSKGSVPVV